ncbi:LysR family transcriptional regulator [Vitreimonas flagellata]|uniref:LysR family transcriptional regulator n=1 Tax=Vitreimonas flagellata TaxID=2560861 RepID=UPI001074D8B3|nr:LysR family transcriptional regulator [Vitreimonas flagellata]
MELDWLEDFLTLVETRNFSRAAELRHITQPAFSRRIRALEHWLGAQLFDRDAPRLALTHAGEAVRPTISEIVRRAYSAREQAREVGGASEATLRFLSTNSLSTTFFPDWVRRIERSFVLETPISLVADNMAACERLMLRGDAHFLLCHHHPAAAHALDEAHFRSIAVGVDTLIAVCAPRSADDPTPRHGLADGGALLAFSEGSGMGRILSAALGPISATTAFASPLASVLYAMARDGRGLAWLPHSLIDDSLRQGELVRAAGPETDVAVEIRAVRPLAPQHAIAERFWRAAMKAANIA